MPLVFSLVIVPLTIGTCIMLQMASSVRHPDRLNHEENMKEGFGLQLPAELAGK